MGLSKEPITDPCKINGLNGSSLDPYSRKGKSKLDKTNCSVINIDEGGSKIFLLGDSISKDLLLAKGYFLLEKDFEEHTGRWKSTFGQIKPFKSPKILLTNGNGPIKSGILINAEKGNALSQTLKKTIFVNDM